MTEVLATLRIPATELHMEANATFYDDLSVEIIQGDEDVWLSGSQFANLQELIIATMLRSRPE